MATRETPIANFEIDEATALAIVEVITFGLEHIPTSPAFHAEQRPDVLKDDQQRERLVEFASDLLWAFNGSAAAEDFKRRYK